MKETEFLNTHPLITAKPVVYLLNLSEKNFISKKSKFQKPVFEWVQVSAGPRTEVIYLKLRILSTTRITSCTEATHSQRIGPCHV